VAVLWLFLGLDQQSPALGEPQMNAIEYQALKRGREQPLGVVVRGTEHDCHHPNLVAWGYIKKVDLHEPDTGASPTHYRFTDKGKAL
jgi:hypothetical protein